MKVQEFVLIAAGAIVLPAAPLAAQGQLAPPVAQIRAGTMTATAGPPVFVGGANNFEFIAAGPAFSGEAVTGSPYSAEAVTETQQALADGNKISRTNSSKIFRDSQGRTRREQSLGALGPWSSAGEPTEMVFIDDPVSGVNYILNTKERTAQKAEMYHVEMDGKMADAAPEKDVLRWKTDQTAVNPPVNMVFREHRELKQGEEHAGQSLAIAGHAGAVAMAFSTSGANIAGFSDDNVKTESLGTQMIEGVEAEGTRTTMTIPAGQIGNERPIEVVNESWYSPQLKTLVLSKQSDPRMGETTYKLTNVQLVEPLPTLFEVPADYTIQEGPMKYFERKLPPPDAGEAAPGR
jgi:hypothetical protein